MNSADSARDKGSNEDAWFFDAIQAAIAAPDFKLPENVSLEELVQGAVQKALPDMAGVLLRELRRRSPGQLRWLRRTRALFERNLRNTWGEALERMWLLYAIGTQAAEEFDHKHRMMAAQQHDFVFEACTRLHGRASQVTYEAIVLLEAGLATGALSRWRTLHEIATLCFFLRDHGQDTAERYLLHDEATAYARAQEYNDWATKVGDEPISQTRMDEMRQTRDALRSRFGSCFDRENAWATSALAISCPPQHAARPGCRVAFVQIEAAVGFDAARPFVRLASHGVHAGARALRWNIATGHDDIVLQGPSDGGLADPIMDVAGSFFQATTALLLTPPSFERLMLVEAMSKVVDEIADEAMKSHRLQERRRETGRRLWRWQDWLMRRRPR